MIELLLTLIVASPAQEAQATLQSCQQEEGRWVCRYQMPDVEIVPMAATGPSTIVVGPVSQPPAAIPMPLTPPAPVDTGVLTDTEARLVTRCAEANWLSLCLPHERREARSLREKAQAYDTLRLEVTRLLSEQKCNDAVRTALAGGSLGLARQAREFCGAATATAPAGAAAAAASGDAG